MTSCAVDMQEDATTLRGHMSNCKGRNSSGEFRTAVGKVYPSGLNQAIGRAVCRYAAETLSCELLHHSLPESFFCYQHQIFEDGDVVQPAFHRFSGALAPRLHETKHHQVQLSQSGKSYPN